MTVKRRILGFTGRPHDDQGPAGRNRPYSSVLLAELTVGRPRRQTQQHLLALKRISVYTRNHGLTIHWTKGRLTMKHSLTLVTMLLVAPLAALHAADAPRAADKPNLIFINIDDLGYADIGPFGSTLNRTPHLDRMAKEGRKLTCFYAAPVCSPSRAALMTGCYPKRSLPTPMCCFRPARSD
jgi:hypothetical protein